MIMKKCNLDECKSYRTTSEVTGICDMTEGIVEMDQSCQYELFRTDDKTNGQKKTIKNN